jgi:pyrimidine operon attenuation protein/uracil phosphoribosyltransferase
MKVLMNSAEIRQVVDRIARDIVQKNKSISDIVLVGIRTRGVPLARRIGQAVAEAEGVNLPLGLLDINLYRDDFNRAGAQAEVRETRIPFAVEGKCVVLVDDVLYTGRTVRAALDAIVDLGRPRRIELAVLIDRGGRELPIQADFVGKTVLTSALENISVHLEEIDGRDEALLDEGDAA